MPWKVAWVTGGAAALEPGAAGGALSSCGVGVGGAAGIGLANGYLRPPRLLDRPPERLGLTAWLKGVRNPLLELDLGAATFFIAIYLPFFFSLILSILRLYSKPVIRLMKSYPSGNSCFICSG